VALRKPVQAGFSREIAQPPARSVVVPGPGRTLVPQAAIDAASPAEMSVMTAAAPPGSENVPARRSRAPRGRWRGAPPAGRRRASWRGAPPAGRRRASGPRRGPPSGAMQPEPDGGGMMFAPPPAESSGGRKLLVYGAGAVALAALGYFLLKRKG